MLTGQNGILTRAAESKVKTEDAEKQENARMQGYEDAVREYTDGLPKTDYTKPYLPSDEFSKKEGDSYANQLFIRNPQKIIADAQRRKGR